MIGAPRSGTTSLYEYLSTHPDVFMSPVKEPEFFSGSSRHADLDRYLALFERAGDEKVRGEASTGYLAHPTAAIHLQRCVPEARIIAILRDPPHDRREPTGPDRPLRGSVDGGRVLRRRR